MLGYALKEFHAPDPYQPARYSRENGRRKVVAPLDQSLKQFSIPSNPIEAIDKIHGIVEKMIEELRDYYMDVASTNYNFNWVYRCLEEVYVKLRLVQGHLGELQFKLCKQDGFEIERATNETVDPKAQGSFARPAGGGFRAPDSRSD